MKKHTIVIGLILGILFMACKKEKSEHEKEIDLINQYNAKTGFQYSIVHPGIYVKIIDYGDLSQRITDTSKVTAKYKIYYLNSDTAFYETKPRNLEKIDLLEYIPGWRYGLPLIGVNGTIHMIFPSLYTGGVSTVPNTILRYEVTVGSVWIR